MSPSPSAPDAMQTTQSTWYRVSSASSSAGPVVAVHTSTPSDLSAPAQMTEQHHRALVAWQRPRTLEKRPHPLRACFVRRSLGPFQLSPPRPAPAPHLIDREVPGHPPDPGRERHVSRFVLLDRLEQLGEDRLRYVLGFELVADDSAHVSVDRRRVTDVQIANGLTVSRIG